MHSTREVNFDPVHGSQQTFRRLLDAMARPGQVQSLTNTPLAVPAPWPVAVGLLALTLVDQAVALAATGQGADDLAQYLQFNTGANLADPSEAEYVFGHGGDSSLPILVSRLRTGTLEEPHTGATLVVAVQALGEGVQGHHLLLTLAGPGIPEQRQLAVSGLSPAVLAARAAAVAEFPMGIELVLVDPRCMVACLPRSTQCVWEVSA